MKVWQKRTNMTATLGDKEDCSRMLLEESGSGGICDDCSSTGYSYNAIVGRRNSKRTTAILGYSFLMALVILSSSCIILSVEARKEVKKEGQNASTSSSTGDSYEKPPPNILLILADDLGTGDIPGYFADSSKVEMPNIADLISKGVLFTDAHATPLCAPSRYLVLSGNYPHRGSSPSGTWTLLQDESQFRKKQQSIAQVLRDGANYHTAAMGKWHLGGKIPPDGLHGEYKYLLTEEEHDWEIPFIGGPQDIGFDSSLITLGGIQSPPYSFFRNGVLTTDPKDVIYWDEGRYKMPMGISEILGDGQGDPTWDSTAYNMILVNETARFLDEHITSKERSKDPFFAYVALGAVHYPHTPPDDYGVDDGEDPQPVAKEYPTRFMDMVSEVDMVVGSLISMLEERNLLSDTIIIFTSDNGGLTLGNDSVNYGHLPNGDLRGSKGQVWEGGHRIPFIVRYDNVYPAGEKRNHLIGLNDLYATFCDIAGIPVPKKQAEDSITFADYIVSNDDADAAREYLGTWSFGRKCAWKQGKAIRKGKYKLVKVIDRNCDIVTMLFDLDEDISESNANDLSSNPEYAQLMKEMDDKLTELYPEYWM